MNIAHKQRIITGLVLLAVLIISLILGGWVLRGVLTLTAVIGVCEFYSLFWSGKKQLPLKIVGMLFAAGIVLSQGISPIVILGIFCLSLILVGFGFLFSYSKTQDCVLSEFSPFILGLAYVPLILHLSLYLTLIEQCIVLAVTITSDVGAYYAGNAFGRHRIWPVISPKKSVEGALGGLVICVITCVCLGYVSGLESVRMSSLPVYPTSVSQGAPVLSLWAWAIIGVILNAASQFGDFFESALKRSLHVKDSGTILPGHGGVLDRIDSLLFVLPAYFAIRMFFSMIAN